MHQPIKEGLEEYLRCSGRPAASPEFTRHLESCGECREEVAAMREQSVRIRTALSAEADAAAGFYARVILRIEAEAKPTIWNILLEPFGRRIVYAALVLIMLLGGVLVSTETPPEEIASLPEVMLINNEEPAAPLGTDQERDRDAVLVNLTTYRQ